MDSRYSFISHELQQQLVSGISHLEVIGTDICGRERRYVPGDKLKEYWSPSLIREALCHLHRQPPVDKIRTTYLRVFTTLVFICKVEYIHDFTSNGLGDDYWPLNDWPLPRPSRHSARTFDDFFDDFRAAQWTFFPLEFDEDKLIDLNLATEHILPIRRVNTISGTINDDVRISTIAIDEDYNKLHYEQKQKQTVFLLKTYNLLVPRYEEEYRREHDAYSLVASSDPCKNITRFYGSFQQEDTGSLILEYVEGGDLLNYLRTTPRPQTPDDIRSFWKSISGLPFALHKVHQATETSPQLPRRAIIHQDIKANNILVARGSGSIYEFTAKLSDFGHSGVAAAHNGDDMLAAPDTHGNTTYAAPEKSRYSRSLEYGSDVVTPPSDIWSTGCLLVDLAAWVVGGFENIAWFREMRATELSNYPRFSGSAYGQAFHNGAESLQSNQKAYEYMSAQLEKNPDDQITQCILDVVHKNMLTTEPQNRLTAKQIWSFLDNALCKVESQHGQGSSRDRLRLPGNRPRTHQNGRTSPGHGHLTIDQCVQFRTDSKNGKQIEPGIQSSIEKIKRNLGAREHIFLIDDSPTMQSHLDDIVRVFTGLSCISKLIDPNRIELAFASSPTKNSRIRSSAEMIKAIRRHKFEHDAGMMEYRMGDFMKKAVFPHLPNIMHRHVPGMNKGPLTVFVFADGCWGRGGHKAAGDEEPILSLIKEMEERKVDRPKVMIQFLRFGDNADGKAYLRYLDEMGQKDGR